MSNPTTTNAAVTAAVTAANAVVQGHNLRNILVVTAVAIGSALGFNYISKSSHQPQAQQVAGFVPVGGGVPVANTLPAAPAPAQFAPPPAASFAPAPIAAFTPTTGFSAPTGQDTVMFAVASVGRGKDGSVYLNSHQNYRMPGNQAIKVVGAYGFQGEQLLGRQVMATGASTVSQTGGKTVTVNGVAGIQVR